MKKQIRSGVVLTEVCGEHLLLATLDASRYCPYVYQINETAAFFWRLLEQQFTEEQIAEKVAEEYEVPVETAQRDVQQFIDTLLLQGYLLPEETAT